MIKLIRKIEMHHFVIVGLLGLNIYALGPRRQNLDPLTEDVPELKGPCTLDVGENPTADELREAMKMYKDARCTDYEHSRTLRDD